MRARTAVERLPRGVARLSDGLLDCLVLAFAAWTVIYHLSLAVGVGALWAGLAGAVALVPSAWLAFGARQAPGGRDHGERPARWTPRVAALAAVNVAAALASAALFAFTDASWVAVWSLWILAAGAAGAVTVLAIARPRGVRGAPGAAGSPLARTGAPAAAETAVVLLWAVALAVLSLFLLDPDGDDTQYVHLSAWVAAHGRFPLRDTLFSAEEFPAVIFPPVSSLEALFGTIARATGLAVPDLVYLVLTPVASALAVLSLWRLLRSWRAPMVGVALSVSLVFLLMATEEHRMLGRMFVGRLWQGKVVFLAVLVPLLYALLHEYAEEPTRRRLVLLAAVGAAGVGLTSTGTFLVPVVAASALLAVAVRSPARAAAGFAATVAYPVVTAVAVARVGPRNADVSRASDVVPERLVERVLGEGTIAFVTLAAVLIAPLLIRRALAGAMVAATLLVVGFLYAPGVPVRIFHLIGLGAVQWRWTWAIPAAALVGALATGLLPRVWPPALRATPAVLLAAVLVAFGKPIWSADDGAALASAPAWKREPATVRAAERILRHLGPGESVLAPRWITQTVLVMSGEATAVAPRAFYVRALGDVRGGRPGDRLHLLRFTENGLGPVEDSPDVTVERDDVVRALRRVRVDLACVASDDAEARQLLVEQGYSFAVSAESLACLRAPE